MKRSFAGGMALLLVLACPARAASVRQEVRKLFREGVDYFHVSTDEVYYAGICERYRKPYNPVNRSLTWVDFVNAAHAHLAKKGRRIIIWVEFPLLTEHIKLLPPDVRDGIIGGRGDPRFIQEENARGIRQFAYCPIQGEEKLFPDYFAYADRDGRRRAGRLTGAYEATVNGKAAEGNPIGMFSAAWDDADIMAKLAAATGMTPEALARELGHVTEEEPPPLVLS